MVEPATQSRPLRADARRNRDSVLESAVATFAEHGVDASLEEIARRAGVGIGTLYRHFPTREALVEAAYRRGVENLCDAADDLLASNEPDVALEQWMYRFVGYIATKRGLAAVLKEAADSHLELFSHMRARIDATMNNLLAVAAKAGTIRSDIDASDVLRAIGGVCMVSGEQPGWQEQSHRLIGLLMDGMRYTAPTRAGS